MSMGKKRKEQGCGVRMRLERKAEAWSNRILYIMIRIWVLLEGIKQESEIRPAFLKDSSMGCAESCGESRSRSGAPACSR